MLKDRSKTGQKFVWFLKVSGIWTITVNVRNILLFDKFKSYTVLLSADQLLDTLDCCWGLEEKNNTVNIRKPVTKENFQNLHQKHKRAL
jgi:hypothetical protein